MKRLSIASLLISLLVGVPIFQMVGAGPSFALPPCVLSGNGSSGSPWLVHSSGELQCFESGTWIPSGGSVAYVSLLANVTKSDDVKLFSGSPGISLRFSGNSKTITVDGVSDFTGIFRDFRDSVFEDFTVAAANGSFLKDPGYGVSGFGWVVEQDFMGSFDRVHITADISEGNGGIIGAAYGSRVSNSSSSGAIAGRGSGGLIQWSKVENSGTPPTRIDNCFSTGEIGASSGGLLGISNAETEILRSYSTGFIMNGGAGGLVGQSLTELLVKSSYSTGLIGYSSGGIVGRNSEDFQVENVYTSGNISLYGGGIAGANASKGVVANSYVLGDIFGGAGGIFGSLWDDGNPKSDLYAFNVYVVGAFVPPTDGAAGIAPPGPNTAGSGVIVTSSLTVTYVNIYSPENGGSPGWSDTTAAQVLVGYQGWGDSYDWIECTINTPALITDLYTTNPCAPPPTPSPSPPATLPDTGVTFGWWGLVATSALAIGAGLLGIRRRKPRA